MSTRTRLPQKASGSYDYQHKLLSRQLRAAMPDGTPCARCGRPMFRWQARQLDHSDDRMGYLGLSHKRCNLRAGAVKGNKMRARRPQPWRSARQW